jgi:7-cyano-7-deazaguanine synthase in queuosine biosynthesis
MDSTVAATWACHYYPKVHLLHFNYGAKAEKPEDRAVENIYQYLKEKFTQVEITKVNVPTGFFKQIGGSTLVQEQDQPDKIANGELGIETAHEWVPARNLVMMALAAAYCDRHDIGAILLGLNMEESCFTDHPNNLIRLADGTTKLPSQVKVGDKLIAWDEINKKITDTKVTKTVEFESNDVYRLTVNSGRKWKNKVEKDKDYEITIKHRFYIKGKGWLKVGDIKVGDVILHMADAVQMERNTHRNPFKGVNRSGKNNPMFGHVRGKICHCGKNHRKPDPKKIGEGVTAYYLANPEVALKRSQTSKKYWKGLTTLQLREHAQKISMGIKKNTKARLKATGYTHANKSPKRRREISKTTRAAIADGRIPSVGVNGIPSPNKLEIAFIQRFKEEGLNFKFVGDGSVWLTDSKGRKLNPDFINLKEKKIIEVTGSDFYWYHPQKLRRRKEAYRAIGWDCISLTDKDLKLTEIKSHVEEKFGGLENGMTVVGKRKLPTKKKVYDFTCFPHHNYFVGTSGLLSHNSVYKDNSPEFYEMFEQAAKFGTQATPKIIQPLGNLMKSHIVKLGMQLEAPLHLTWSCYRDGDVPCGTCGPDLMRQRAFKMAGLVDPLVYATKDNKQVDAV